MSNFLPEDLKLSQNFSVSELMYSETATKNGIDNRIPVEYIYNAVCLCYKVLQPLRDEIGYIAISSGYRSPKLNKSVGGGSRSQHTYCQAVDIVHRTLSPAAIVDVMLRKYIPFDQVIRERDDRTGIEWLHISYRDRPRGDYLDITFDRKGRKTTTRIGKYDF